MGLQCFIDYPLKDLVPHIDWTPFFHTWELKGSYPKILNDIEKGVEAKKLFNDAQVMLEKLISEKWISAAGVVQLFPANSVNDDDVEIYTDEERHKVAATLCFNRQQQEKPPSRPNQCLADFVAPKESELQDYVGLFAVTAGIGIDEHVKRFEEVHDDYSPIMLKALADRLAEAFAEHMHEKVRKETWSYAKSEDFTNAELVKEQYAGIRPAPGYPANPDDTKKDKLWSLLDVQKRTGISITEHFAMLPTASVSGMYFSHPDSKYFAVGKIARDQVESYAERKNMSVETVER